MAFAKEWRWRRLLSRQHDLSDCGPACLAAISAFYHKHVAVATIRQMAKTDPNGTTLLGIVEAAIALGFDAKGVRADSPEIVSLPAIVHVIIDSKISHYIVLANVTRNKVVVMDPAEGKMKSLDCGAFKKIWTGIAVLLKPAGNFIKTPRQSTLRKISGLMAAYRGSLTWASVCAAIVSLLGITISVYVRELVDVILVRKNNELLVMASAIAILILLIQGVITIVKGRIVLITGRMVNAHLITAYFKHVLRLPQSFFDSMRVGEMLSRINDAVKITAFIHEFAVNLVVDALIIMFSIGAMFYFNWRIGLLVASVIPVYAVLYIVSNKINKVWQRRITVKAADLDASLVESFGAASTIKHLALENYFAKKMSSRLDLLLTNVYAASSKQLNVQATAEFFSRIVTVVLLWVGASAVMRNTMTTGELMLFYTLLTWFTPPLLYLLGVNKMYNEAVISAERLFEILELEPIEKGWKRIDADYLNIEFRNVWFAYGYNDYILRGIDLTVNKGMTLGISGKSGSGKSTLASLLLGHYEPTSGRITINGVNIHEIEASCVGEMISIVSQKTDLFSATIRENITIGMQHDEERLNSICERLGITQFASSHSSGLDMILTEQGSNISGGQRQRIAIARAIYRNTPLLILDEATAAIDRCSEEKIMQTIEWYKNSGNTVIIIAHSESTLKICDNIVILNDGVIK